MTLFLYPHQEDLQQLLEKNLAERRLRQTLRSIAVGVAAGGAVYATLLLHALISGS